MNRFAALVMAALAVGACSCGGGDARHSTRSPAPAPLLVASVPPIEFTVAPMPNLPAGLIPLGQVEPGCPGTEGPDGWCAHPGLEVRWYASRLPAADTAQNVLSAMSSSKYYRVVSQYRGQSLGGGWIDEIKLRSIGSGPHKGSIDVLVERAGGQGLPDPRRYGVNGALSEVQVLVEPKVLAFHQAH